MNPKHIAALFIAAGLLLYSCSGSNATKSPGSAGTPPVSEKPAAESASDKGIGKFQHVVLSHPLDENLVKTGGTISDIKCASCHKMTEEKLVGPGWKGVTERRTPEWIMNFITNVDEMLDKDPDAQALLEICMVRMPNQNLSDEDARAVLEYMRKIDDKN